MCNSPQLRRNLTDSWKPKLGKSTFFVMHDLVDTDHKTGHRADVLTIYLSSGGT